MAYISESNGRGKDEEEDGDSGQDCERFGKVLWFLHLGDEGWEENLGDPEESDIEHGVHTVNPRGAGQRRMAMPIAAARIHG